MKYILQCVSVCVYECESACVQACLRAHIPKRGCVACFRDSEREAYLYNLGGLTAGRRDCILPSPALFIGAFSLISLCEFSPCKSLTIGPLGWYKGLWIKQEACGSASRRGGRVGGSWKGVSVTSGTTTLKLNTCLCCRGRSLGRSDITVLSPPSALSVAMETLCARTPLSLFGVF